MSSAQQPPDLASILQTLAQHSGQPAPSHNLDGAPPQSSTSHIAPQPSKPVVDPSKITSYPPALRYTTSLLGNNPNLTLRIKKLIKSQHDHERQWWHGRGLVPAEHRKRMEGRQAVNDVLRSLGGIVPASTEDGDGGNDEDSEEAALRNYDRKVYAAYRQMVLDVRKQLKEMGIPGFVIRSELIGDGEGQITRAKVNELEGKMLQLLEDLCKD